MQTFNSFNELAATGQITENDGFDMSANPNGTSSSGVPPVNNPQSATNPPPKIPQWGTALGQRMTDLEKKVEAGFAEMKADIEKIKQAVIPG